LDATAFSPLFHRFKAVDFWKIGGTLGQNERRNKMTDKMENEAYLANLVDSLTYSFIKLADKLTTNCVDVLGKDKNKLLSDIIHPIMMTLEHIQEDGYPKNYFMRELIQKIEKRCEQSILGQFYVEYENLKEDIRCFENAESQGMPHEAKSYQAYYIWKKKFEKCEIKNFIKKE
jgi:hypothetical protein